ncbi:hypothetical protein MPH_05491 [Macrophomina phaseolina MS6]|uniref:Uncharacterized protein n=1 Tax=Macrophomina phaseolina (strain MS6) TaxID=1126212 RepID=K2R4H6_MACPH|nr:hypothetical protein MPH_05491 [Macrophomina phaseolina MS6]
MRKSLRSLFRSSYDLSGWKSTLETATKRYVYSPYHAHFSEPFNPAAPTGPPVSVIQSSFNSSDSSYSHNSFYYTYRPSVPTCKLPRRQPRSLSPRRFRRISLFPIFRLGHRCCLSRRSRPLQSWSLLPLPPAGARSVLAVAAKAGGARAFVAIASVFSLPGSSVHGSSDSDSSATPGASDAFGPSTTLGSSGPSSSQIPMSSGSKPGTSLTRV